MDKNLPIVRSFGICHDRKLSPFLHELKKLLDSVHVSFCKISGSMDIHAGLQDRNGTLHESPIQMEYQVLSLSVIGVTLSNSHLIKLSQVQISPLTVTLFTVTPRLQWHFRHVPNDWFVTELPLVTVTIWLQWHFSHVPRMSL